MARLVDRHIDTIEISSDDESDAEVKQEAPGRHHEQDVEMPDYYAPAPLVGLPAQNLDQPPRYDEDLGGTFFFIDGEEIFIPDEEEQHLLAPPLPLVDETARDEEFALALANEQGAADAADNNNNNNDNPTPLGGAVEVTADQCLQRVLAIFPDISHDYVNTLYNDFEREGDYQVLSGDARLENIIEQLVSNPSYPKQEKGKKALKRKRQDSIEDAEATPWERTDRVVEPYWPKHAARSLLKAEFPDMPLNFINTQIIQHKHLFQTYVALYKFQEDSNSTTRRYGKGRPPKNTADADTIAINSNWPSLIQELEAARLKVQVLKSEKEAQEVIKRKEKENLEHAIAAGELTECTACFEEYPMNRQIHCDGQQAHFLCFGCAIRYIQTEVGESRCRVVCTAGCGSGFANSQLALLSDKPLLEKLAQLQQEKDIRDAELEDLEECPFCDYKAILPPIEEDFEFRCPNVECEKVSCRRCKSISHIPLSCEEHAKDSKVNSRHKIEEAMTDALIRKCNKCSKAFIKEYGCNKMACPSCSNLQCYVCSATIKDYNHFDQAPQVPGVKSKSKLCPLYDNVEERHAREVKEAEAAARAQVVEDNPDLTAEDLEIKVSDAVKNATAARPGAANVPGAFPDPMHLLGFAAAVEDGDEVYDARRAGNRRPRGRPNRGRVQDYLNAHLLAGVRDPVRPIPGLYQAAVPPPPPPAHAVEPPLQGRVQGYIPVIGFQQGPPQFQQPPPRAPAAMRYQELNQLGPFENNQPFGLQPRAANQQPQGYNNPNPNTVPAIDPLDDLFGPAPWGRWGQQGQQLQQLHPPFGNRNGLFGRQDIPGAFPPPAAPRQQDAGPTPAQEQQYRQLEKMRQQHTYNLLQRHHNDPTLENARIERHRRLQLLAREQQAQRARERHTADIEALHAQIQAGKDREARGY